MQLDHVVDRRHSYTYLHFTAIALYRYLAPGYYGVRLLVTATGFSVVCRLAIVATQNHHFGHLSVNIGQFCHSAGLWVRAMLYWRTMFTTNAPRDCGKYQLSQMDQRDLLYTDMDAQCDKLAKVIGRTSTEMSTQLWLVVSYRPIMPLKL